MTSCCHFLTTLGVSNVFGGENLDQYWTGLLEWLDVMSVSQSEEFTDQGSNMWWLVLCQPDGGFWLNVILDVFMRVFFLDEINIWISRLNKADCLSQTGWAFNFVKALIEQNGWVIAYYFSLWQFSSWDILPSHLSSNWNFHHKFCFSGFWTKTGNTTPSLFDLQIADCK